MLEDYGVFRFFNIAVFSDEVGFSKPYRLIYETSFTHLKVKSIEAIHAGYLLQNDIVSAKAIGMKNAWLDKKVNVNNAQHKRVYELKKFTEVINILNAVQ
jgi:FMN phosphatase YigB (HAD superfamily)